MAVGQTQDRAELTMAIRIAAYEDDHIPAVLRLNARLEAGGCRYRFPLSPKPAWLPPADGTYLFQEYFVAMDGSEARGGYILKHQDFTVRGKLVNIGNFQLPLSEGVVDARYGALGIQLLGDALRRQPLLYALGLGSLNEPVARLLVAAGWHMHRVPFYFRVGHARRFLGGLEFIRGDRLPRIAMDLLAATGIGPLGIHLWQGLRTRRRPGRNVVSAWSVDEFDASFDALWSDTCDDYSLAAVRDAAVLTRLYGKAGRFLKLRIADSGQLQGWAVLLITRMSKDKYFGNLTVGTIVDALCRRGHEAALVSACMELLGPDDVDLIISNQCYAPLGRGLRDCGFLTGPSNFFLATSPALTARLSPLSESFPAAHFTRGDGDGPIHL